jgi:Protein of unknown function (DUF3226)
MKFVFCEGGDDLAVISGVAVSLGLADLQIEKFLGKNKLRQFLKDLQTRPEFAANMVQAIGIVRDADQDGDAAFQCVRDALSANGFNAPEENGGFAENGIKTGVLIVGPKGGKGMVEDLCLDSVCHHPEFSCMEDYFQCITQKSGRKDFSSKARVRVWMASQVDFELYVGKAAEKGYWPWEDPVFDTMKEFLRRL